jgi:hypothetical protein
MSSLYPSRKQSYVSSWFACFLEWPSRAGVPLQQPQPHYTLGGKTHHIEANNSYALCHIWCCCGIPDWCEYQLTIVAQSLPLEAETQLRRQG